MSEDAEKLNELASWFQNDFKGELPLLQVGTETLFEDLTAMAIKLEAYDREYEGAKHQSRPMDQRFKRIK